MEIERVMFTKKEVDDLVFVMNNGHKNCPGCVEKAKALKEKILDKHTKKELSFWETTELINKLNEVLGE